MLFFQVLTHPFIFINKPRILSVGNFLINASFGFSPYLSHKAPWILSLYQLANSWKLLNLNLCLSYSYQKRSSFPFVCGLFLLEGINTILCVSKYVSNFGISPHHYCNRIGILYLCLPHGYPHCIPVCFSVLS